jgi:hypothetical protein
MMKRMRMKMSGIKLVPGKRIREEFVTGSRAITSPDRLGSASMEKTGACRAVSK